MKIKNSDIVRFFNASDAIMAKKMPRKLYAKIDLNIRNLMNAAEVYSTQRQDILKDSSEVTPEMQMELSELLNLEVDATVQMISERDLETIDESDKYDAFTGDEYKALEFMIETE